MFPNHANSFFMMIQSLPQSAVFNFIKIYLYALRPSQKLKSHQQISRRAEPKVTVRLNVCLFKLTSKNIYIYVSDLDCIII